MTKRRWYIRVELEHEGVTHHLQKEFFAEDKQQAIKMARMAILVRQKLITKTSEIDLAIEVYNPTVKYCDERTLET